VTIRTDDINSNGDVDGSLLAGGDAREESGVTPLDAVEHQHAPLVPHTCRQSPGRRPASGPLAAVPADERRCSALGAARHPRAGSQFELGVVRHRLELEPLCIRTPRAILSVCRQVAFQTYTRRRTRLVPKQTPSPDAQLRSVASDQPCTNAHIVRADRISPLPALPHSVYQ